jgi:hypothetical protein
MGPFIDKPFALRSLVVIAAPSLHAVHAVGSYDTSGFDRVSSWHRSPK